MIVLDDSNISESYPGVCSPLTCSFAEETYRLIFRRLAGRMLGRQRVAAVDEAVSQMAVARNGRMYYRIDNWYRLLQVLPFSKRLIPVWRHSLGVTSTDLPAPVRVSRWTRARVLGRFAATWWATPRLMVQLADEFDEVACAFATEFDPADSAALRRLFGRIRAGVLRSWDVTLVNDLRAFAYTALAARLGAPVTGVDPVSMRPVRALAALRARPDVEELGALASGDDVRRFLHAGSDLARELSAYLDAFGDRRPGELKLESQTFRTNPESLVRLILARADADDWAATGRESVGSVGHAAPHATVRGPLRTSVASRARQAIAFRESSRLDRSRLFGMVRGIVRALGANLACSGYLDSEADVFYLTLAEVLGDDADWRRIVADRKRAWAAYEHLPAQPRVVVSPGELAVPSTPAPPVETGSVETGVAGTDEAQGPLPPVVLQGTPASAGVVVGEILVVADPGVDASGKIVVTVATDPGWVFLLMHAAGVITERGSPLSHTAVIARELGLPAVVGVDSATVALRTGDRVRLDATTGRIEVVCRG